MNLPVPAPSSHPRFLPYLLAVGLLLTGCTDPPEPSAPSAARADWTLGPFTKYAENPILLPGQAAWESKDVFNPATWSDGSQVYMLYRAEDSTGIGQWNGTSRIGLATSRDGFAFERGPEPILVPTEPWELPGGCEDPRIVRVDDRFYLTYTAYDGETARLALASSPDLHTWTKHGLVFPDLEWTKSGAILTTPVDSTYWMYFGDTNIWAAYSTDLIEWTLVEEPVLRPRPGLFDSRLIEPGPPPLLTDDGILLLYNSADDSLTYRTGQVLFDRNDPTRVIARTDEPFMAPTEQLEQEGQVPSVVFIEGLVQFQDRWFLYFGMGDSGIGVATADVSPGS